MNYKQITTYGRVALKDGDYEFTNCCGGTIVGEQDQTCSVCNKKIHKVFYPDEENIFRSKGCTKYKVLMQYAKDCERRRGENNDS